MIALAARLGCIATFARMKPAVPRSLPQGRFRSPAISSLPDSIAGAIPEPDPDAVPVLTSRDYSRLKALARLWRDAGDPVHQALVETLGRCRVMSPGAVPPSIVTLGARVTFVAEDGAPEERILAMPGDDGPDGSTLSVATPVGAALLGAAARQSVKVVERDGRCIVLRILAVRSPPWARARDKHGESS